MNSARKYTLPSNHIYGWYTGATQDGRQALMLIDINAEICVLFDLAGHMLETIGRCFDREGNLAPEPITNWPFLLTESGRQQVTHRFQLWLRETIVVEQPIHIEEFGVENRFIGIEDMPVDYVDFLADPNSVDEESREHYPEYIENWKRLRLYLFWWHDPFWMAPDGSVVSH